MAASENASVFALSAEPDISSALGDACVVSPLSLSSGARALALKAKLAGEALSKNQRKKTRKKLGKLGKQASGLATSDASGPSGDGWTEGEEHSVCVSALPTSASLHPEDVDQSSLEPGAKRRRLGAADTPAGLASPLGGSQKGSATAAAGGAGMAQMVALKPGSASCVDRNMASGQRKDDAKQRRRSGGQHAALRQAPGHFQSTSQSLVSAGAEAAMSEEVHQHSMLLAGGLLGAAAGVAQSGKAQRELHGADKLAATSHAAGNECISQASTPLEGSARAAATAAARPSPVAPRPGGPPPQLRTRGADLSGVAAMLAMELRRKEQAAAASISAGSVPLQPGFCRRDMSQQSVLLSAELSQATEGTHHHRLASLHPMSMLQQQHQEQQDLGGDDGMNDAGDGAWEQGPEFEDEEQLWNEEVREDEEGQQQQAGRTWGKAGPGPSSAAADADASGWGGGGVNRREIHRYGNYHRYYGYRLGSAFDEDPRLKVMKREWFEGRVVFDIGCNEGLVTLGVAARFGAKRTTGFDIDESLIKKACRNLRNVRSELTQQLRSAGGGMQMGGVISTPGPGDTGALALAATLAGLPKPLSAQAASSAALVAPKVPAPVAAAAGAASATPVNDVTAAKEAEPFAGTQVAGAAASSGAPAAAARSGSGGGPGGINAAAGAGQAAASQPQQQQQQRKVGYGQYACLRSSIKALSGTRFVHQDWVSSRTKRESADAILCLSVTKWVHLNFGDEGLKRFFQKFYDTLTPGGLLVLEPQPWRSYKNAAHKTTTSGVPFARYEALQLRPADFLAHLTQVVGFEHMETLSQGSQQKGSGFDRPLYLLRKPAGAAGAADAVADVAKAGRKGGAVGGSGGEVGSAAGAAAPSANAISGGESQSQGDGGGHKGKRHKLYSQSMTWEQLVASDDET